MYNNEKFEESKCYPDRITLLSLGCLGFEWGVAVLGYWQIVTPLWLLASVYCISFVA